MVYGFTQHQGLIFFKGRMKNLFQIDQNRPGIAGTVFLIFLFQPDQFVHFSFFGGLNPDQIVPGNQTA